MSTNGQLVFTDVDKITFKGVGNASNAVVDTLTGKIGVGTDSPEANLHVLGNSYVSTNLELGGTLIMGTVNVEAQHSLEAVTATGNITPLTLEFTNPTTSLVASGNVEVGGDLTMGGQISMGDHMIPSANELYDIGSASKKIRHLFLSDNSLYLGDNGAQIGADVNGAITISSLNVSGTGALTVPVGTTGDRPGTAVIGMFRYNSTTGYMEAYTATGWGALATPPSIVSISPVSVLLAGTADQVFTVSGSSFDSGLAIKLVGADGTNYDVVDRTFVNATTTTFKIGDLSSATAQLANRPYTVKITSGSGLATTSIQTIIFLGTAWTSPAAGATLNFSTSSSTSITLAGTDATGGTSGRTFIVAPGSTLPTGLSLNASSGVIDGTIGAAGTTNVTFRVVDISGAFVERTFNIVGITPLYPFTSPFTFTNASSTGRYGPSLSVLQSSGTGYGTTGSTTWVGNSNYFSVSGGIQKWTVPETGTYQIEAFGAGSKTVSSGDLTGRGARMRGQFTLTKSEIIRILVGQKPIANGSYDHGGGGGTFVVRSPYNTTASILVIAGGGGGTGSDLTSTANRDGNVSNDGQDADTTNAGNTGTGGTSGNGGGNGNKNYAPGGGGGFSGDGATSRDSGGTASSAAALSFINGGTGGAEGASYQRGNGGFGGGGAAGYGGGAGGGGYSGGGGVASQGSSLDIPKNGGGGGSYNSGSNQSNSTGVNREMGYVIVTKL